MAKTKSAPKGGGKKATTKAKGGKGKGKATAGSKSS